MVKLKSTVKISANEEGALLLDTKRGTYWHLNAVGIRLAEALDVERSVDELVLTVTTDFDVPPDVARRDVRKLLRDMKKARLVEGRIA
ncbi:MULTISPECIES: PqqD family protein [Nocardiopsidaceae]|uniref:PqqD family protein n=2 Tax=Nocardiopsidaceae TaxID=83676 RepID=A0ABY6YNA9_9ACTN|nr:PqqD family protein [Streptomonospora nanhaiensis]MEE2042181.1 PqqD family protein [Nocardiopsis tropica]WAE73725.1 PqqD family protein [Streptomonospora nanhaiensis]